MQTFGSLAFSWAICFRQLNFPCCFSTCYSPMISNPSLESLFYINSVPAYPKLLVVNLPSLQHPLQGGLYVCCYPHWTSHWRWAKCLNQPVSLTSAYCTWASMVLSVHVPGIVHALLALGPSVRWRGTLQEVPELHPKAYIIGNSYVHIGNRAIPKYE